MRHLNGGNKLSLVSSHRNAMLRNMVTSLLEHGRIRTTQARAKEARRIADKVITLSKRVPNASLGSLTDDALKSALARRVHAIRLAGRWVNSKDVLHTLFTDYSDRYATRPGGYTRILKLDKRPGDQADMVLLELVTEACVPKVKNVVE